MTLSPKIIGVGVLAALVVAYCAGRRDAPDKTDALVSSLMAGINAYHKENARLNAELTAADRIIATQAARAAGYVRKVAELQKRMVALPALVPASCLPWAENLSTCEQQKIELKNTIAANETSLRAAVRIRELGRTRAGRDSARIDSLTTATKKLSGGNKIFGIKLPSRATSFGVGGAIGAVLGLVTGLVAGK